MEGCDWLTPEQDGAHSSPRLVWTNELRVPKRLLRVGYLIASLITPPNPEVGLLVIHILQRRTLRLRGSVTYPGSSSGSGIKLGFRPRTF